MKAYCFALAGNQNCGKTTLFNALTGSEQHVGNFPGVTVEKKEGRFKDRKDARVVDLPGIYSISPYTAEEVVTRDYLVDTKPDCIINIVDATNLERNLYLTLQILEIGIPTVIALNMMDEVDANGYSIDVDGLKKTLGVEIVPISAGKNIGIPELVEKLTECAAAGKPPKCGEYYTGPVRAAISNISGIIKDNAAKAQLPWRYAAARLFEGDDPIEKRLELTKAERMAIDAIISKAEKELGNDRESVIADMRYKYIDRVCRANYKRGRITNEQKRSIKIDKILTNKYLALPFFFCVMFLLFWLTFDAVGKPLSDITGHGIKAFTSIADALLVKAGVAPLLRSLVVDGIFAGVGGVLSFLPIILVLFFMLSILEDTGYMARIAFVMDKLLRRIGLSGSSFVPMLIGFGCSVPAVMAARTLHSERDRKMTILLVPFMSCSAKLPVYAMFTGLFFPSNAAVVVISLYILGIAAGILYGLFFKNTIFKSDPVPFVMELPAYRFPSGRSIVMHMWQRTKDFVKKAFSIIFVAAIVIWFLQSFDSSLKPVEESSKSMLAAVGMAVAPIFAPLGFADWRISTALITGLTAKETVLSTLAVLAGDLDIGSALSPAAAYSFLVFTLLYMPCIAAMAAIKRELGSVWGAAAAMVSQTGIAWLVAFAVYNVGSLFL